MPFVLIVGPSGAGKDTLIRLARESLMEDRRYVFPRRFVTRPPSADEDNVPIGLEDFAAGEAAGRFALCWRAHGLGYALPVDAGLQARDGCIVVSNVSRRIVAEARRRYAGTTVVEITAPPDVLAARLATRGRAEDGDLAQRLARREFVVPDLTVENSGRPEEGARQLVAFLRTLAHP